MKGVIFTEFLEVVEEAFGIEVVDEMLTKSKASGVYTAVGTYDDSEMNDMVVTLSKLTNTPVEHLLEFFGKKLFYGLHSAYPHFFDAEVEIFGFIRSIHNHIHVEVKKLYPDALLPDIIVQNETENEIEILYSSPRKYGPLARGLLLSSLEYYSKHAKITEKQLDDAGEKVLFTISMRNE